MKKIPQRTCVICRTKKDKRDLLRVVLNDDGSIEYDQTGRKPGRGSYLCKSEDCITKEIKAHKLSKGLRCSLSDEDISLLVNSILKEAIND